jgi:hypothetical protein
MKARGSISGRLAVVALLALPMLPARAECAAEVGTAPVTVAAAGETVTVDVRPQTWGAVRLRRLPQGAVVSFDVESDGPVGVSVLNEADHRRYPAVIGPLFRSEVSRLSFSVSVPATADYFLVLDNPAHGTVRRVAVTARAARAPVAAAAREALTEFEREVERLFVFEPFTVRTRSCGTANAFAGPAGITLCAEYVTKLYGALGDGVKTRDALVFTLFHELGHVLLKQWHSPVWDNEEVADEFATVVMVMLGQGERVRAKAEYFVRHPSVTEALAKTVRDDRHPLSAQRARNIRRWLGDPGFARKWQPVFVPRLRTPVLERLAREPTPWTDSALVEKELAARK